MEALRVNGQKILVPQDLLQQHHLVNKQNERSLMHHVHLLSSR